MKMTPSLIELTPFDKLSNNFKTQIIKFDLKCIILRQITNKKQIIIIQKKSK